MDIASLPSVISCYERKFNIELIYDFLVGKFSTAEPPGKSLTPSTWAVFLFYDWKSHVKSYIIPCKVYLKECTLPHTITMYLHSYSEKAMAPQSSTLAWQIPWTEEPGGLQSVGSRRVGHNWATSLSLFTFMHWRRKWQPTPVFLPGESQVQGSLVGCRLWGHTESDATEAT